MLSMLWIFPLQTQLSNVMDSPWKWLPRHHLSGAVFRDRKVLRQEYLCPSEGQHDTTCLSETSERHLQMKNQPLETRFAGKKPLRPTLPAAFHDMHTSKHYTTMHCIHIWYIHWIHALHITTQSKQIEKPTSSDTERNDRKETNKTKQRTGWTNPTPNRGWYKLLRKEASDNQQTGQANKYPLACEQLVNLLTQTGKPWNPESSITQAPWELTACLLAKGKTWNTTQTMDAPRTGLSTNTKKTEHQNG